MTAAWLRTSERASTGNLQGPNRPPTARQRGVPLTDDIFVSLVRRYTATLASFARATGSTAPVRVRRSLPPRRAVVYRACNAVRFVDIRYFGPSRARSHVGWFFCRRPGRHRCTVLGLPVAVRDVSVGTTVFDTDYWLLFPTLELRRGAESLVGLCKGRGCGSNGSICSWHAAGRFIRQT